MFSTLDPARRAIAEQMLRSRLNDVAEKKARAADILSRVELETERRLCNTYREFVKRAWNIIEPTQRLIWNWHHDVLSNVLEGVSVTPDSRGIINVPPGTMKSLLCTVFYRAWLWRNNPALRFLAGSYGSHLSIEHNVKLRNIVVSDWYKRLYPSVILTDDVNRKERFDTTAGGWSVATSVGGVGTGQHPNYIFIDDPLTAQQARSEADRNAANAWIDGTLSSRGVALNVRTLLVMQRLHEEDPTGHLLAKGGWWHVKFPMRFEGPRYSEQGTILSLPDPLDIRTHEGQLLFPQLFTEEKVRKLEIDLDPYGAAGQLQQRPSPDGGGLFNRSWFRIIDRIPQSAKRARRCRGWDTASSEGKGDYTTGVRLCEIGDDIYIEDVVREQLSPSGVNDLMLATAKLDGTRCSQREEKEPGSSGVAVIDARRKLLKGFDYSGVQISKDKVTRARPFRAQVEGGNVFLVRSTWNESYLQESSTFPTGKHDDCIDATSCAYNSLISEANILTSAVWGSKRSS